MSETKKLPMTTTWMRLARWAAIVMVIWSILLQITAGQVIPPVLVVGLIFLGFAPFLSGERRRLGIAYAIVTILVLVGNAPVILDQLTHPLSAPSFVLTLLSIVAAATAIVAGLGAFFRWPTAPVRAIAIGTVAVFVAGAAGSIALSAAGGNDVARVGDTTIVAEKIAFAPNAVTLAAGTAGVWIENKDGIHHTFTVEELGVDLEIPALKARRVDIDAVPGTYTIICTVPGHENMTGTLVVEG